MSYEVKRCDHGIAIFGSIGFNDLEALMESWEKSESFELVDALIAQKLGACFVFTDKAGSEAWRSELSIVRPPERIKP